MSSNALNNNTKALNETKQEIKTEPSSFFSSIFGSSKSSVPVPKKTPELNNSRKKTKGLYLYGTPGCGKTFLMDMFYNNIPFKEKERIHFNEFMLKIHDEIHKQSQVFLFNIK